MMPLIGLLVLVALVTAAVLAARRPSTEAPRSASADAPPLGAVAVRGPASPDSGPTSHVSQWVAAGLLTAEDAAAILTYEGLTPAPDASPAIAAAPAPARTWSVAEALGYLGGMLALIGLVLVVARYWADMATGGRLLLSGSGALALLAGGFVVKERAAPALARLRGFLWLASTAAAALFMGVLAADGFGAEAAQTIVLACAGLVTVESGLLWRGHDRPIQQATFLIGIAAFAGALVALWSPWGGVVGIAVWVVGIVYLVLGLRRLTPEPVLTEGAGGLAAIVGATIMAAAWQGFGLVVVVATAMALVAVALTPGLAPDRTDQLTVGVLGGLTLLQAVPSTLGFLANDAGMATGLVTWGVGAAIVYVGAQHLVRLPLLVELVGGAAILGGAAITAVQWSEFAPIFGIVTAVGLVALGMLPGQVLLSVFGSLGLLANVPWAISRFFPGEARAPLLILVSGALILLVAVILSRSTGRSRRDRPARPSRGARRPPIARVRRRPAGTVF